MKKIYLSLPFLLVVGGCNGRSGNDTPSLDMMAQASTPVAIAAINARPRTLTLDEALGRLPEGAGLPKSAFERRYANGYSQEITLASDVASADSHIEIAIQNGRPLAFPGKAPVWKPGEAGIRDELTRQFPNMRMQVVTNGGYENQYGRFGVAVGRLGENLRCVYAWQYVDDARKTFFEGRRIPLDGATVAPASMRIKLCRTDTTVDDLVDFVRHFTVAIPENFGAQPAIAIAPAPRPVVVAQAPKKRARPTHSRVSHAAPQAAPYVSAGPYAAAAEGPRYMAPVPVPVDSVSQYGRGGLNSNLPPQAFRGPATGQQSTPGPSPYQRSSGTQADPATPAAVEQKNLGAPRVVPMNAAPTSD